MTGLPAANQHIRFALQGGGLSHAPERSVMNSSYSHIQELLGDQAEELLGFEHPLVAKSMLNVPRPEFVDEVWSISDRSDKVRASLKRLFGHGRLGGTGYLSILPVDQAIEHAAGAVFSVNPQYFDPVNIVKLAVEGGCNAVASTLGGLGMVAGEYAGEIPFVVKINHNELLSYPNQHDQTMYASVEQAFNMGAVAVGATVYFGSPESRRQLEEVGQAFELAHRLGMATILWCYVRNPRFTVGGVNYEASADLTAQANHLGCTIEADIIKQKLPENNGGYQALNSSGKTFGKFDSRIYSQLTSSHPIDLARYQVLNCYAGRVSMISSGGPSGKDDLKNAVKAAVINKRAGGAGLIAGRKAFQRPFAEGVELLHAIQDVYLCEQVTVA